LRNLAVEVEDAFCSIVLTSLDGKALGESGRMLLVAAGRVAATGMSWDEKRHTLVRWGRLPMRIEPVKGTVTLRGAKADTGLALAPLDGAAAALTDAQPPAKTGEGLSFRLAAPTVWYLLSAAAAPRPDAAAAGPRPGP